MKIQLAKQLKDAGFPQDIDPGHYYVNGEKEIISIPSFSELIGACGDSFAHLEKGNNEWFCNWSKSTGSTPEEAVANLWLKLNEKK